MNGAATYTNASHAAVVRVDAETGDVRVLWYLAVHDCGRVLNPMIVEGQVQGGVVQGIGGTLLEEFSYTENGQPLATSFMDYLLPTAAETPRIEVEEFESPAPEMPFGVKGAGEAGIIGPAPAIAQAIEDALADLRIERLTETPITAPMMLRRIETARDRGSLEA